MTTVHVGDLVYLDSFSFGLIPAKVVAVDVTGSGEMLNRDGRTICIFQDGTVSVKLTANRGRYNTYKRGELLTGPPKDIIPRDHVSHRKYGARIFGVWTFA